LIEQLFPTNVLRFLALTGREPLTVISQYA